MKRLIEVLPYYLNHKLRFKHFDAERDRISICRIAQFADEEVVLFDGEREYFEKVQDIKPILLPLSSIIERQEDRKTPIYEMSGYNGLFLKAGCGYDHEKKCFYATFQVIDEYIKYEVPSDYTTIKMIDAEYLFKHHFDVFGLIESGQAIDKRTISRFT